MPEVLVRKCRNRIRDRAEVIDDDVAVDPQPLLHQGWTDHPRTVGELEDVAADRTRERQRELLGKLNPGAPTELLPRKPKAAVLGCRGRARFPARVVVPAGA